eukprot:CAMPEP_0174256752 /NCGR_PEP_ID=MMETSP0439-20130205/5956_1 /TAXON_ID=0 /ORGANISM="Stereomyxa ramosa, Strain Chinc5" /LENGTH=114 /DNA_ID=CAMNT_0015339507 /DNA_START=617 /DNA_END=961 /DNA_ORIENTATION=-
MASYLTEISMLEGKGVEYLQSYNLLKNKIRDSGATADLTHSAILEINKELDSWNQKFVPLERALQDYHNLPTNLSDAKDQLEKAKKEYEELERRFGQHIQGMLLFETDENLLNY